MPACSWRIGVRSSPTRTVTDDAPGRSARTVTPPSAGCAPRIECGSWCAPPARRSSSSTPTGLAVGAAVGAAFGAATFLAAAFLAGFSLTTSPHQPLDRAERYRQPGRSVTGFVDDLVDGLVELHRSQQHRVLPRITTARAGIAVTEGVSVSFCPFVGAIRESRAAGLLREQMLRCVVERPQHASDVAERAHQGGALRQGACRLALEVDDLPAAFDAQGLAQVEVAVDALHRHPGGEGRDSVVRRPELVG